MNRKQEIDEILKYWAKIAKENPELNFNSQETDDLIYKYLIYKNVSHEDKKVNLSVRPDNNTQSTFEKWINNNYRDNTDVFVSPQHQYFCQFVSTDNAAREAREHLKVYIPLDQKHIEIGANLIFNFLADNNISHQSKIGKRIRFDDIVVRLVNPDDLKKFLEFIRTTPYIQEGLIKPNAFAFQHNGIALACDGDESYNATVTSLIDLYISIKKQNNELDRVGYEDFYTTIANLYNSQFVDKNDNTLAKKLNFTHSEIAAKNYKQIISLILKAQSVSFNLESYIEHFKQSKNEKDMRENGITPIATPHLITPEEREKERQLKELLLFDHPEMLEEERIKERVNETLVEAVKSMQKKYSYEDCLWGIESYVISGQEEYLTRTDDLRRKLSDSSWRKDLIGILKKSKTTFEEYANRILIEYGYSPANNYK